jgi:hypothetical protein
MQEFEEEGKVMSSKIKDPQSSLLLWPSCFFPCYKTTTLLIHTPSIPKQVLSIFIHLIQYTDWDFEGAHEKGEESR